MEGKKKDRLTSIIELRQDLLTKGKSDIDIINSVRLGTDDYDFDTVEIIKEGGQAIVFEIKSKINGRIYAAKRLQYQVGSKFNSKKIKA
jgi:hypothetical protein